MIAMGNNKIKRNFTLEDKRKLCETWTKTTLSKNAFIKKHKLPRTFFSWCNKFLPNQSKEDTKIATVNNGQWLQVIPNNSSSKQRALEIKGLGPIKIELCCNNIALNLTIPAEQVITFIKELADATTIIRK